MDIVIDSAYAFTNIVSGFVRAHSVAYLDYGARGYQCSYIGGTPVFDLMLGINSDASGVYAHINHGELPGVEILNAYLGPSMVDDYNTDFDYTLNFTITETIICKKHVSVVGTQEPAYLGDGFTPNPRAPLFWGNYHGDEDAAGLPPQSATIYYEVDADTSATIAVTWSGACSGSWGGSVLLNGGSAYTFAGSPTVPAQVISDGNVYGGGAGWFGSHYDGGWVGTTEADEELAGQVIVTGWNVGGPWTLYRPTDLSNSIVGFSRSVFSGGQMDFYTAGWMTTPSTYDSKGAFLVTCPSYAITWNGNIADWDGARRSGIACLDSESNGATSTADTGVNATWSESHGGMWGASHEPNDGPPAGMWGGVPGWGTTVYGSPGIGVSDAPGFSSGADELQNSIVLPNAWITNCKDEGEPDFAFPDPPLSVFGADPPLGFDYREFSDKRVEIDVPELAASGAYSPLVLDIPAGKAVVAFASGNTWTADAGSIDGASTGVHIVVTADATAVSCTNHSTDSLAGARYADFVYASDDTDAVTVEIAGRQYSIKSNAPASDTAIDHLAPDTYRIDLLHYTNTHTPTNTESAFQQGVGWDWGIGAAGTIKLIGLRIGKHYDLTGITLRRINPAVAHIFRCPFVGAEPDDPGGGDPFSIYNPSYDPENPSYVTRTGVVLVDGVVGAEIFGVAHTVVPVDAVEIWRHWPLYMDGTGVPASPLFDGECIWPNKGLVTVNSHNADYLVDFLSQGVFTQPSGSTVGLSAKAFCSEIRVPCFDASRTMQFTKYLRGQHLIRAINTGGSGSVPVTVTPKLVRESGSPIALTSETINVNGYSLFSPKPQSQMDWGTVVSGSGDTYVVSGLDRDYTGFRLYVFESSWFVTITSATLVSGSTWTLVLTSSFSTIVADALVYVMLEYEYIAEAPGATPLTLSLRNRCLSFATLLGSIAGAHLRFHPDTGDLKATRQGAHHLSCGCPGG